MTTLSISRLGVIYILASLVAGALLIGTAVLVLDDARVVGKIWNTFEATRSEKARALSAIRREMGYGGMIHHFKNYVLRGGFERHLLAREHIGNARAAVKHYKSLNIDAAEDQALSEIDIVLRLYEQGLNLARAMIRDGSRSKAVDKAVSVNDSPAFKALDVLNETVNVKTMRENGSQKPVLIYELRARLGYGGMIHHYKNLVLRQELQREKTIRETISNIHKILSDYKNLKIGHEETEALGAIERVIVAYEENLNLIHQMISAQKSTLDIDKAVKVDDGPALEALNVLTRTLVAENTASAEELATAVVRISSGVRNQLWAVGVIVVVMVILTIWVLRFRIVLPLNEMTRSMRVLADGDLDASIPVVGEKTEIGRMAAAMQVFKNNEAERRLAQEAVEERERWFRQLLDSAPDATIIADPEGVIKLVNKQTESLFGYQADELIGKKVEILVPEAVRSGHAALRDGYVKEAHSRTMGREMELSGQSKSGKVFPVEISLSPIQTSMGMQVAAAVRDISARKKAEKDLESKQIQLELAMNKMTDGMFLLDKDMNYTLFNEQYKKIMGFPDDLIRIGASVEPVVRIHAQRGDYGEGEPDELVRQRMEVLAGEQQGDREMVLGDGSGVIDLRKAHIDGGGAVVTISDITDRKKAERTVAKQRQVLQSVLENTVQAVVAVDANLDLIICNQHFQDLLRLPDNLVVPGTKLKTLVEHAASIGFYGDGDKEELVESRMKALSSGKPLSVEIATNDALIWYATLQPNDDGGFVMSYTDITERKMAEIKMQDAFNVISSSIDYASRIQRSVLPDDTLFTSLLSDHFVLWEPRDVVGGDIYWSRMWGDGVLIILGDCTGHGVPGAFMTLIATGALDNALSDIPGSRVAELMQRLHQLVQVTLGQHGEGAEADDGMELGMCYLTSELDRLIFVGARFELFLVEDDFVSVIKGTKSGIGYHGIPHNQEYEEHEIVNLTEKSFYMTSDGMIDQVGGERNRMYGKKRFRELLLSIQDRPMKDQKEQIYKSLVDYQGEQNRRDDVAVIGFKIP